MPLTKTALIAKAAETSGVTKKDTASVLDALLNSITETLTEGDSVQLTGFGTFATSIRSARTGRNPLTGEDINVPETKIAKFKPGTELKKAVKDS